MGRKSNYSNRMYQQLQEIMRHLEAVEKEHKQEVTSLKQEISDLKQENQLLREDNTRFKSILQNDSSNTSLPPFTDQKGGKPANTFSGREKSKKESRQTKRSYRNYLDQVGDREKNKTEGTVDMKFER